VVFSKRYWLITDAIFSLVAYPVINFEKTRQHMKKLLLLFIACMAGLGMVWAQLQPAGIFTDHMVLQRNVNVPVWGTATAGEQVKATIGTLTIETTADAQGNWRLYLPPFQAGGPHTLTLQGENTVVLNDVLFGDVWVASGQSNMEWRMNMGIDKSEEEIAAANYPNIRLFVVEKRPAKYPKNDLDGGSWMQTSPATAAEFSAVAYFFGRHLHEHLDVPIGLINCNWGGTVAEAWTSYPMLQAMPDFQQQVGDVLADPVNWEDDIAANEARGARRGELLASSNKGLSLGVHERNFDDSGWKMIQMPNADLELQGIVWFRKVVNVDSEYKKQKLHIDLGRINEETVAYFNGEKIGTAQSPYYAEFDVPADLVRSGENALVLRVSASWGSPQWEGPVDRMKVTAASGAVVDGLSGTWRYNEAIEPELPQKKSYQNYPAALYNGMVAPIIPYGIKGVIWYQGESNAGRAFQYQTLFPAMIEDWRVRWKQGYFPFLFVQLANFMDEATGPEASAWAELREAQRMALRLPNTGMAVAIDIGEAYDIHPRNKQDVGKRLALAARRVAYDEDLVHSGPLYQSMEIQGDDVEITFDSEGSGLMAQGGTLKGFTIAGSDKKFYEAKATIIGANKLVVSSEKVKDPVAVRYGWANNPVVNLYNKEGLPASPFRTDDWPGITHEKK
jgi:sialate O-acetylesterase